VPESEVDAPVLHAEPARQRMFMVVLKVVHQEQVAVGQIHFPPLAAITPTDLEGSGRSEAQARNATGVHFGFVVPVEAHRVLAIPVAVDEHGVQDKSGCHPAGIDEGFHASGQLGEVVG
jgi:hypothetical protein